MCWSSALVPPGSRAASEASKAGAHVLVLDENPAPGGQIWRGGESLHSPRTAEGRQALCALTRFRSSGAQLLAQTRVIDAETAPIGGSVSVPV